MCCMGWVGTLTKYYIRVVKHNFFFKPPFAGNEFGHIQQQRRR